MKFKQFVGIDVSKSHLDVCYIEDGKEVLHERFDNSKKAWRSFVAKLKKRQNFHVEHTLFCLENTGNYSNPSLFFLHGIGASVWMEMPIHIIRSQGFKRGKSDKIDAARIAWYAHTFNRKCRLWEPARPVIQKLKILATLREKLIRSKGQYASPKADFQFIENKEMVKLQTKMTNDILRVLMEKIKQVEKEMKQIIQADEHLNHLFKIVHSVDGIGLITATDIIINTNEFKTITDPRKYACYSGVAPFEHSSGSSVRKGSRISNFANKNSKRLFHMAAMSAIVKKGELQSYYQRKVEQGKPKMSALNAVRNKLIHRVFSCVRRDQIYVNDYTQAA